MTNRLSSAGIRFLAALIAWLPALASHAVEQQDPARIQAHAERFVKMQTADLRGKVAIEVKPPRATLPACAALDAFQPAGSRVIGKTIVGVKCLAPTPWTVYLPVHIRVSDRYVVARQPLSANQVLSEADLLLSEGDLGELPPDVVNDPAVLIGYRTVSGVAAGAPLRSSVLKPPLAVQQGQTTRLVLNGPGFSVHSDGEALANASRGDRVRVRTRSGQVVTGIAQDAQQVVVPY